MHNAPSGSDKCYKKKSPEGEEIENEGWGNRWEQRQGAFSGMEVRKV